MRKRRGWHGCSWGCLMFLRKSLADSPRAAGAGGPLRRIAPASLKNYPSRGSAVLLQHRCNRVAADQFLARYIARQFAKTEDKTPFLADGTSTVSAKRMPPKKCPVDYYTPAVFSQNRLPTSRSNGWKTIRRFWRTGHRPFPPSECPQKSALSITIHLPFFPKIGFPLRAQMVGGQFVHSGMSNRVLLGFRAVRLDTPFCTDCQFSATSHPLLPCHGGASC